MLIHPWDQATREEWRDVLHRVDFGQLIVSNPTGHPFAIPCHYVYDEAADEILLHLARPNPVWPALAEQPRVLFSLVTDYSYIEAAWNADSDVPPELGVPTSYYTAVQFRCRATIVDDPEQKLQILRRQLLRMEPEDSARVPPALDIESDRRQLPGIRGVRLAVDSVLAKMKYGGNKSPEHRLRIADELARRGGPMDGAARDHLLRRKVAEETGAADA